MSTITLPETLTNGTVADADDVMDNLNAIVTVINGSIDEDNISATAALSVASVTTTGQITTSIATGTAPLVVSSTTAVSNLNADKVDGYDVSSGMADKTRTIALTAGGAIIPSANGCNKNLVTGTNFAYYQLEFDKDADEYCYWIFPVPDQYDGGACVFEVISKCETVTSGTVVWVITTESITDSTTWDVALGTTVTFDAKTVDGTALDIFTASKSADPGWAAGEIAIVKLMRDISEDDAAEDVDVIAVKIEYEVT